LRISMSKLATEVHHTYSFNGFSIDLDRGCLLRGEQQVKLRPKVFDALRYLVENNNRLVTKAELIGAVWGDSFVTDDSVVQCLVELRRALGGDAQEYIKTVPRRGYIFDAAVTSDSAAVEGYTEQVEDVRIVIEEDDGESSISDPLMQADAHVLPAVSRALWIWGKPARILLVCLLLLVGVAIWILYFRGSDKSNQASPVTQVRSIAVLPFKSLSADGSDEYLGLGMADILITRLSSLRQVIVRPTSSVRKYMASDQDPIAAGREQRVDAVLEGSIQRLGDKMRLTVRLLNVEDGSTLWAYKCDEYCTDIFALQDRVSEQVVGVLALELTGDDRKLLAKHYTDNTEAYRLYLKGRYYLGKYDEEGFKKGLESFKQAIDLDPNYALAYAGVADAYYALSNLYLPPAEAMPKARAVAMKALELDETLAEAHASLALVKSQYEWEWAAAEREYKRALELNPGFASVHFGYSTYLIARGRPEEALAELKQAHELDPLSHAIDLFAVFPFYYAPRPLRQYDRAIEELRKLIAMDPNFSSAHSLLGGVYLEKGMHDEAVEAHQKAWQLGNNLWDLAYLVRSYAMAGRRDEAQKALGDLRERARREHVAPNWMAVACLGLGEKDQALTWLEKAYEDRDENMTLLNVDPAFDSLHADPRFIVLLRRIGLS
jgi:DNA-binding winged helix-turn-helix (wHTH) protein/TolB-like protein/Flp pilus assembly protein TadD